MGKTLAKAAGVYIAANLVMNLGMWYGTYVLTVNDEKKNRFDKMMQARIHKWSTKIDARMN